VIVTELPTRPLVGLSAVTVGAGAVTVKLGPLAEPPDVVTLTVPVVAPTGTVAVICVALLTVNAVADTVLNFTADAPVRLVPVITTELPTRPLVGLRLVTVGAGAVTVKLGPVTVPPAVVTLTAPVMAPEGTVAVIFVALLTTYVVAEMPLNFTAVAPVKLVPVRTTELPTKPLVGLRLVSVGA
jgi:hypothetical protein